MYLCLFLHLLLISVFLFPFQTILHLISFFCDGILEKESLRNYLTIEELLKIIQQLIIEVVPRNVIFSVLENVTKFTQKNYCFLAIDVLEQNDLQLPK